MKKIQLNKETLRRLDDAQLDQAHGGITFFTVGVFCDPSLTFNKICTRTCWILCKPTENTE